MKRGKPKTSGYATTITSVTHSGVAPLEVTGADVFSQANLAGLEATSGGVSKKHMTKHTIIYIPLPRLRPCVSGIVTPVNRNDRILGVKIKPIKYEASLQV